MIKVIFIDMKDGEVKNLGYNRAELKLDSMARMRFNCEVEHLVCHFIGKLREERKGELKCQKP